MDPVTIETILKFYMENLPEDKLAELDARLTGDADNYADSGAAMDSAMAKRKTWAAMDSVSRQAVRKSRVAARDQEARNLAAFRERFPNMDRLGR